jgi:hypothetical protein
MQNGALYPLPTLVQTISVKEFGSEPNNETFFHTPNTTGMDGGSNSRKALKKRMWLTPRVVEVDETPENFRRRMNSKRANDRKDGFGSLTMQVKALEKLPTPQASDHRSKPTSASWKAKGRVNYSLSNPDIQKMWPTPVTRDWKDSGTKESLTRAFNKRDSPGLALTIGALDGGYLNPNWVEWLMNWPITWSNLNAIDAKEYQRWKETSTKTLQKSEQLSEMWWDKDPSQASFGQQPNEQSEQQHCNAVPQMPRDTTRQREMEGSYEGSDLPLLCNDIHLSESQAENVQSGMWEQISVDETKIVPRTEKNIVARVDRLKAIGNGQVPLCAATAWELLK